MEYALEGRTALVTCASFGVGKQTAIGLAELGATVVGVADDRERAAVLTQEIRRVSNHRDVEVLAGDMASLGSVHDLVDEFGKRHNRLHVLVNTAGGVFSDHALTSDGVERTFTVNYLSTFLLTNLLADVLRASAPARIVNVCGSSHRSGHLDFHDLQGEHLYRPSRACAQAQLASVVFTYELASRLDGSGVTVNCVEPGSVDPVLDGGAHGALRASTVVRKPFTRSPRRGASSVIKVAADPGLERVSAEFFNKSGVEAKTSDESYDPAVAQQLWKVSEQLTGLVSR